MALASILAGCSGGNPVARWQQEVTRFIDNEHNGDINAIRHYAEPEAQREFGIIGASTGGVGLIAPTRSDTTGVLLGRANINNEDWHVFLVGVITYTGSFNWLPLDDPAVEDIRLAAFRIDSRGHYVWRISEPDPSQLAVYLSPQHEEWGQRYEAYPDVKSKPHTVFPWEGDKFDLNINAGAQSLTAVEQNSGATWTLDLNERDERERLAAGEP